MIVRRIKNEPGGPYKGHIACTAVAMAGEKEYRCIKINLHLLSIFRYVRNYPALPNIFLHEKPNDQCPGGLKK